MAEEGTPGNPIVIHRKPPEGVPSGIGFFAGVGTPAPAPTEDPIATPTPPQGVGFFADMSPAERAAVRTSQGVRGRYQAPGFDEPAEPAPRSPDVDYATGAPMSLRIDASRMDNPAEMALLLGKRMGEGKYGQDPYGNWWVDQGGKPTAIFPRDSIWESTKNLGAGMAGSSPAMAGAVAGAVAGEALFPLGGGIPGAMIGAAGGKGTDEIVKYFGGLLSKTPTQQAKTLLNEGSLAGVFQGAAPVAQAIKPAIQSGLRRLGGVTPESATMAGDLVAGGARPPIGSLAPDLRSLEYKRGLRNVVMGDPVEAERGVYLDDRVKNMLTSSGTPPAAIDKTIAEIQDTGAAISSRPAGEGVITRFRAAEVGLLREEQTQREAAERALRGLEGSVRAYAQAAPDLADKVAGAIKANKKEFSDRMSGIYKTVDNLTGDRPVVPTDLIRAAAKDIVDVMDPQAVPPILRRWASDDMPAHLTFEQAHALRTTFREMAEVIDVSPIGQKMGNIREVARAVDDAIRGLAFGGDIGSQVATDALKAADRLYFQGIRQFTDATLNKLVRDVRSGLIPDPGLVAKTIGEAGQSATTQRLKQMLPTDVWKEVEKADLGNKVKAASYVDKEGNRVLDGQSFLKVLDENTLPYSDRRMFDGIKELAKSLAVLDGKMNVEALTPGAIKEALQRAVGARRALDEFARTNPRVALASGEPEMIDRAANYILAPGAEARTLAARNALGVDSAEWKEVQSYAIKKLLADVYVPTQSLGRRVSGTAVDSALAKYTPRQQAAIFGPDMRDDLRLVAKEARFLFPQDAGTSGLGTTLAGASTMGAMPSFKGVRKYFWHAVSGFISDNPRIINFLANEIRTNPEQARTTMSIIRQSVINGLLSGPGQKKNQGSMLDPSAALEFGGAERLPAKGMEGVPRGEGRGGGGGGFGKDAYLPRIEKDLKDFYQKQYQREPTTEEITRNLRIRVNQIIYDRKLSGGKNPEAPGNALDAELSNLRQRLRELTPKKVPAYALD